MPLPQKQTRPPLQRMVTIHRELAAEAFPNCSKLALLLQVSPKTVQRDLDFMRDELELPVEYNAVRFGYFYSEKVCSFPGLDVSEGELVALLVAQKAMAHYRGTDYEKPLAAAFRKITESLPETIFFRWDEADSGVSFQNIGPSAAALRRFEKVSKSVLRSEEIAFAYRNRTGEIHGTRQVQAYHLGCVEGEWFFFGFDLERQQIRTFALRRMRKVKRTGRKFLRPPSFPIGEALVSGEQTVVLEFDTRAAFSVAAHPWPESQIIEPGAEGLRLTLRLGSLEEVERWVLSWGTHVRVIEPAALAEKIAATARRMVESYATAAPRAAEI